ncbi:hypothetical protein CRENBAI_016740 [Crenichthys baileyi]|uniref:Uncharacterized protein n=1 Tax=Crenichthys baileyi TaxID=28760 RepID=A0AAV9QZ14_9TELE
MWKQDMLHRPTHPTANRSLVPGPGLESQKEASEEGQYSTPRTGHPANPTPKPWKCPQHTSHPHPRMAYPAAPSRPAGQLFRQTEATSQSVPHTAWPRPHCRSLAPPRQPTDQAPKPGTEIQTNPNDPKRAEMPGATLPADPNRQPVCRVPTKEGYIGTSTRPKARDRHRVLRTDQHPLPSLEPSKPSNPNPQPQHPVPHPKKPPTPKEEEPAENTYSDDQECGSTPKKKSRPAGPVQQEYASHRRTHDQHGQPPNPRGRASRAPSPQPQPQPGQRGNKTHPKPAPRPGRPTQMQAPSQHRHKQPAP